jgi:polar amino acid transport system substrate-binding protein/glutamate/aspartate transport system substrate-binding protein
VAAPFAFADIGSGTTTEQILTSMLESMRIAVEVVSVTDHNDGLRRIEQGDITVHFADQSILTFLMLRSAVADRLELSDRFFTREPYALAMPPGRR